MTISREILAKYAKGQFFVETGTRWGDTVIRAVEEGARRVWSIEIDKRMFEIAREHIADALRKDARRVVVSNGDSAKHVAHILPLLDGPVVFFLDAHTDKATPILEELAAIAKHPIKTHTILIDDMSVYRSGHWAVTDEQILDAIHAINTAYVITFENDLDILVARVL